jgi:integrase/recombinase XerD
MGFCDILGYVMPFLDGIHLVCGMVSRAQHNRYAASPPPIQVTAALILVIQSRCTIFESLFSTQKLIARHRDSPLAEERLAYLRHRSNDGMARGTLIDYAGYLLAITERLRLSERGGELIGAAEVLRTAADWARRQKKTHAGRTAFGSLALRWLTFMGRLEKRVPVPPPYAAVIAAYESYMRDERGLSPVTIAKRCWFVQHFFKHLKVPDGRLDQITIADIDAAFLGMASDGRLARATLNVRARSLRSFFAYSEGRGLSRAGLATAIHVPRLYAQESLPRGPSWDQVQSTLALSRGDQSADIRASAIIVLFAVYALRAREVARLRLDDMDWDKELLVISGDKTGRTRTYPLARSTGDAIIRYLKEVRPRSPHREVFLTLRAPFRPLTAVALYNIVAKRTHALGIPLSEYGPRSFRHACATHLLNEGGLSMKEVGDHLGHRDPDSTQTYAKVNLASLRVVANLDLGGKLCDCTTS